MNKKLLTLLFFGVLMMALDIAVMGPALPTLKAAFAVKEREITWIFSIYLLFSLVSNPLMGRLSDRFGRRIVYTVDLCLFGAGSLIIAMSGSFWMLLLGRAVQGFGAGGIFPVASAVIGDTFPRERQGRALGMIGAVFGFAFIVGPIIGGIFLMYSWRLIFLMNLPLCIGLIYFSLKLLPNNRNTEAVTFDWLGVSLLMISLGSFAFGVNRIDTADFFNSLTRPDTYPFLIVPMILLPIFYRIQKRVPYPSMNHELFHNKQIMLTNFITIGGALAEILVVLMPSQAKYLFGLSDSQSSFMLLPLVFSMFIGAPLAGALIDKTGPKPVILAGIVIISAGMFGVYFFGGTYHGFFISTALEGIGLSALVGSPLRYIINRETLAGDRASAQALLNIFKSSGQLLFAAMIGALITSFIGSGYSTMQAYSSIFLFSGVITILLLLPAFMLKGKEHSS